MAVAVTLVIIKRDRLLSLCSQWLIPSVRCAQGIIIGVCNVSDMLCLLWIQLPCFPACTHSSPAQEILRETKETAPKKFQVDDKALCRSILWHLWVGIMQFGFSHMHTQKHKFKAIWDGIVYSYVITMEFYLFQILDFSCTGETMSTQRLGWGQFARNIAPLSINLLVIMKGNLETRER